jgi:hypothetical protein
MARRPLPVARCQLLVARCALRVASCALRVAVASGAERFIFLPFHDLSGGFSLVTGSIWFLTWPRPSSSDI